VRIAGTDMDVGTDRYPETGRVREKGRPFAKTVPAAVGKDFLAVNDVRRSEGLSIYVMKQSQPVGVSR